MMEKIILCPDRVRKITGTFGFIEHRFLSVDFQNKWTFIFLLTDTI
jgi:hypothetical protein